MDEPDDAVAKARENASRKLLTALQLHHSGVVAEPEPEPEPEPSPALVLMPEPISEPCPVPERTIMPADINKITQIKRLVCERFGISDDDITSHSRKARVVLPRQIAMYLARRLTDASLPRIGRRFGGKDHATILHAVRKIEFLAAADLGFFTQLAEMSAELSQ